MVGGDFRQHGFDRGGDFQLFDEGAAELVQRGNGDVAIPLQLVVERAEFKRRITEPAQLRGQSFGTEWMFGGLLQQHFTLQAALATPHFHGFAGLAGDNEVERGFFLGGTGVLPEAPQLGIEFGVGSFVEGLTRLDAVEVDPAVGEVENQAVAFDHPDACALFEITVFSRIEDDAIARVEGHAGEVAEFDPAGAAIDDFAQQGAALFAEFAVRQIRMVGACEPARAETTREGHFQFIAVRRCDRRFLLLHRGIERLAVNTGDGGDVFGRFEATFDLERFHPGADKIGNQIRRGEILRTKEITDRTKFAGHTVHHDLVGHAAGLGAFAAVGTALAQRLAGQALAGIRDAEGPVDKNLQRSFGFQ